MIFFGTTLGGMWYWWLQTNNRRARVILIMLTLGTLAFTFIYLPYAYRQAQPNGLRDAVLTETFGQQPLSGKSMVRSAYIPNPDEFYGTAKPQKSASVKTHPVTSILWLFFWMFAFLPFAWTCAILYAVISLREETWKGAQNMVGKIRDWISNLSESGISGTRSAGGAQGGLTFSAPVIITSTGAAAVDVEKSTAKVPWVKIMSWLKRNSGEIIAGLFVIDEVLELGMARRGKKTKKERLNNMWEAIKKLPGTVVILIATLLGIVVLSIMFPERAQILAILGICALVSVGAFRAKPVAGFIVTSLMIVAFVF